MFHGFFFLLRRIFGLNLDDNTMCNRVRSHDALELKVWVGGNHAKLYLSIYKINWFTAVLVELLGSISCSHHLELGWLQKVISCRWNPRLLSEGFTTIHPVVHGLDWVEFDSLFYSFKHKYGTKSRDQNMCCGWLSPTTKPNFSSVFKKNWMSYISLFVFLNLVGCNNNLKSD